MALNYKTLLLSATLALGVIGQSKAQQQSEPSRKTWGTTVSVGSYHFGFPNDMSRNFNGFNPGLGMTHALYPNFLKKHSGIEIDITVGGYYNSIRNKTFYSAMTLNKRIAESRFSYGIAAGVFGYQHMAKPIEKKVARVNLAGAYANDRVYYDVSVDRRARGKGPMHFYPIAAPRFCFDFIDNKKAACGVAIQGGYLPKVGGIMALTMYGFLKK